MKIPGRAGADTADVRRQIQAATEAVDEALAGLDGAVEATQPIRYPHVAYPLGDLAHALTEARFRLELAAQHLGKVEELLPEHR